MKTWDQFLPDVLPSAPKVSQPLALRAIMRAAQEFCQKTRALLAELDPVITTATDSSYPIALPSRTELVRIEFAKVDGADYGVWTRGDRANTSGRFIYTRDAVNFAFSGDFRPAPGASVVLTCAIEPASNATGIDDVIFRRYAETIAIGALSRLVNPALQETFEAKCAAVRHDLWKGSADTRMRSKANFF